MEQYGSDLRDIQDERFAEIQAVEAERRQEEIAENDEYGPEPSDITKMVSEAYQGGMTTRGIAQAILKGFSDPFKAQQVAEELLDLAQEAQK